MIRVLPFGGQDRESDVHRRSCWCACCRSASRTRAPAATCRPPASRRSIAGGRYTLAISDFLLTGGEANLGFLTRQNPEITDITDFRDIRMAVIEEIKKAVRA